MPTPLWWVLTLALVVLHLYIRTNLKWYINFSRDEHRLRIVRLMQKHGADIKTCKRALRWVDSFCGQTLDPIGDPYECQMKIYKVATGLSMQYERLIKINIWGPKMVTLTIRCIHPKRWDFVEGVVV